jgi:hypothetical protein
VSAAERAEDWLRANLSAQPVPVPSESVRAAAAVVEISPRTLSRAARGLGVVVTNTRTFPRATLWSLPEFGATEPAFTGPQRPADSHIRRGTLRERANRLRTSQPIDNRRDAT